VGCPEERSVAKILVADDNSNIQKMVGIALKDQGIDVVAVGNGEAAVRKISDVRPDLVLADVFMPVRNGYEVCRYVKEDSSLAHIPVILLVGAFDPLDEQEAQRVGADGVLKKPFVPPDPLISMVKSALMRAGVSVGGPVPLVDKPAPAPSRSTADILAPSPSKFAAPPPEELPEVTPEPIEEFAAPREQVKFAEGSQPVAFGNLLDTQEEEDVAVFSSKPMIELAKDRDWTEETKDVPEEEDEEESSPRGGWRAGSIDEDLERAATSSKGPVDWRDEAFHGKSPAKNGSAPKWTSPIEQPALVEAASLPSAAVSTIESKPEQTVSPFAGDAWASALAADVEEKIAEIKDSAPPVSEVETAGGSEPNALEQLPGPGAVVPESHAAETPAAAEPASTKPESWTVPESPWEAEAKRASLLASTWDAPPVPASEETQEVSAYTSDLPEVHTESAHDKPAETSAYSGAVDIVQGEPTETPANEAPAEAAAEKPESKSWATGWEAPAAAPETPAVEEAPAAETVSPEEHVAAPDSVPEPAPAQPAAPDMDELVARVLAKMNPDVLQRVTQEILKPVVEAIISDELKRKDS
jgi:CheY-like chemotaxis protein